MSNYIFSENKLKVINKFSTKITNTFTKQQMYFIYFFQQK